MRQSPIHELSKGSRSKSNIITKIQQTWHTSMVNVININIPHSKYNDAQRRLYMCDTTSTGLSHANDSGIIHSVEGHRQNLLRKS